MINEEAVIQKFIDVIRAGVGSQLAQVGPTGSQYGAVTRKRANDMAPPQPYIVIDIEDRGNVTPLGINKTVDINDNIQYQRLEDFLISFRCYGSDAQRIINGLHIYLDMESVRDLIRTDISGAIRSIDNPTYNSITVGDRFVESSSFNIDWSSSNEVTDTDSTIINTAGITYTYP